MIGAKRSGLPIDGIAAALALGVGVVVPRGLRHVEGVSEPGEGARRLARTASVPASVDVLTLEKQRADNPARMPVRVDR
jgi:hypothetical protein